MTGTETLDTNRVDGKTYSKSLAVAKAVGSDGILNYRFYATDSYDVATGTPTQNSVLTVLAGANSPPTLQFVAAGGSGWYSTIQAAIDAINNAHTVMVYDGTYNEDLVFDGTNDRNTTLRSVCGPDTTIITGSGLYVSQVPDPDFVYTYGDGLIIRDSIISGNTTGGNGGGVFSDLSKIKFVSGFASEDDPWFVGGGDYHIQAFSPAIDNASATYAPADDIDGDSRPQGVADDIGADEVMP